MPGLRSLRNRLALIFALIIAGAIGTIYLSVTPRLEASLTSQRLNGLIADSKRYLPTLEAVLPAGNDPPPPADATVKERTHQQDLATRHKHARDARGASRGRQLGRRGDPLHGRRERPVRRRGLQGRRRRQRQ